VTPVKWAILAISAVLAILTPVLLARFGYPFALRLMRRLRDDQSLAVPKSPAQAWMPPEYETLPVLDRVHFIPHPDGFTHWVHCSVVTFWPSSLVVRARHPLIVGERSETYRPASPIVNGCVSFTDKRRILKMQKRLAHYLVNPQTQ
jgi:hypothetical protein